jgi:hypothetical protein
MGIKKSPAAHFKSAAAHARPQHATCIPSAELQPLNSDAVANNKLTFVSSWQGEKH